MKTLRCHRCRSDRLVLTEVCHEVSAWDEGLLLTPEGHIVATGSAKFEAGEIQPSLTRIACQQCGHEWHPRRWFDGGLS